MKPEIHTVVVRCDEPSHAPKVATIYRAKVQRTSEGWRYRPMVDQQLVGDVLQDNREVHGTRNRPPNHELLEQVRLRWTFKCPLCGLRVDMKQERAGELFEACAKAGVSELRLSFVAATV